MPVSTENSDDRGSPAPPSDPVRAALPLAAPFLVYMLIGLIEPMTRGENVLSAAYAIYYVVRIVLTTAAVIAFWRHYRGFRWRISLLAVVAGVVGGPLWIGLCQLPVDDWLAQGGVESLADLGARAGFNPFVELAGYGMPAATAFFAVRMFGLVLLVPLFEEVLLRGVVMRLAVDNDWRSVALGTLTPTAWVVMLAYAALTHPAEIVAALVWFSMVTLLAWRTRSLGDCVLAHAMTNATLGVYAVTTGDWGLL